MSLSSLLSHDNLPSWFPLHHVLEPKYNYSHKTGLESFVDLKQPSLYIALASVFFNPIFWNIVARNEYRNKSLTKIFRSPYLGCYVLAISIFSLGIIRDGFYHSALQHQPHLAILSHPSIKALAAFLFGLGQIFVVTSIYALGITGTYLGDYFGILMKSRVTGFPFNVLSDPMYVGSTMAFLGTALWYQCPAGIAISAIVWIVYAIALRYEGPFTDKIYSSASPASASQAKSTSTPAKSTPAKSSTPKSKPASTETSTESVPAPKKVSATSATPRKAARKSGESYAEAAAEPPSSDGLPSVAPKVQRTAVLAASAREEVPASPRRMTRSRSKARGLGSGDDED